MQSQRPSAAAQLQQLQQMQAQFRQQQQQQQQQQSSGVNSGSNTGNGSSVGGPSQIMASRGMGGMAQPNIPQLPPHQMLSSQLGGGGNPQQWQQGNQQMSGNQQSGGVGIGINNVSYPLMANQQLQQQLQSQLLSSQQGSSGGQGQIKNQQQDQAALYWNALAASGNNNSKSGQPGSGNMSNITGSGNFPSLNVGNMGNMDMMNNSNAMSMIQQQQQQQQHQMNSFINGSGNQHNQSSGHQLQQFQQQLSNQSGHGQGQGNQSQQDQGHASSLPSNMLGAPAPNPSSGSSADSMDFSGLNFNLPQDHNTSSNSTPAPPGSSSGMQNFNQDLSSNQQQQGQDQGQGQVSSEQLLIQQQKIIAQLQRQIQQFTSDGNNPSPATHTRTDQQNASPAPTGQQKPMLPQTTSSNRSSHQSNDNPSGSGGNSGKPFLSSPQPQPGMNQSNGVAGLSPQLQQGFQQNTSGQNFFNNNNQLLSPPNNLPGNLNPSLFNNLNQAGTNLPSIMGDTGSSSTNNQFEMLKQQQQQLMISNDHSNLSGVSNPSVQNPQMFPKGNNQPQPFDINQKPKNNESPDDSTSAAGSQLTHQQLFEWQLKNFSAINRLNQQNMAGKNDAQNKPAELQSKPTESEEDEEKDDSINISKKSKKGGKNTGKKGETKEKAQNNRGQSKNQAKSQGKVLPKNQKVSDKTTPQIQALPTQPTTEEDPNKVLSLTNFSDPNSLIQEIPSQKGLDKSFIGGWQSNADLPDRRRIIVEIVRVIEKMRPDANKMTQKLPLMAKKLEEHLYHSAPTKEDYVDSTTLKKRLQMIAHGLGVRRSSDSVTSNAGTPKPNSGQDSQFNDLSIPTVPPVLSNQSVNETQLDPMTTPSQDNLFPLQQQIQHQFPNLTNNNDTLEPNNATNNITLQIQQQLNMLKQKQQQLTAVGGRMVNLPNVPNVPNDMPQIPQGPNPQGVGNLGNHQQGLLMQLQQQQLDNQQHLKSFLNANNDKSDSMVNNLNQLLLQQYQTQNKTTGADGQPPPLMNNDHIQKLLQNHQNKGSQDNTMPSNMPMDNLQDSLRKQIQQAQASSKSITKLNDSSLQTGIPPAHVDPKTVPDPSKSSSEAIEDGNVSDAPADEISEVVREKNKKAIRQQQYRLLLLRHASKCTLGAACKTQYCSQMVPLWKHMKKCRTKSCTVPHCLSSRCVLNHYRMCKSEGRTATCEVCAPVLKQIKWQQQSREQQSETDPLGKEDNDPLLQDTAAGTVDTPNDTCAIPTNQAEAGNNNIMNLLPKIKQQSSLNTALPNTLPFQAQTNFLQQQTMQQGNKLIDNKMQDKQMQQQLSQLQQATSQTQAMQKTDQPDQNQSMPQSEAQNEQSLQQKHLILQQLQLQQAQLQEQQKGLMMQQQQVQPNSPQARQLQQQLSLLVQLQQLFQQQQQLVQHELKRLSTSKMSNQNQQEQQANEKTSTDNDDATVKEPETVPLDSNRGTKSTSTKTRRNNSLKRSKPENPASSPGAARGKCFRKGGKSLTKPKVELNDMPDNMPEPGQKKVLGPQMLNINLPMTNYPGNVPSSDNFSNPKRPGEDFKNSGAPAEKKSKVEAISSSLPPMDTFKKEEESSALSNYNFEPDKIPSDNKDNPDDNTREKVLQQQPGYVEAALSLIPSMSLSSIEQHIHSLEDVVFLTPQRISQKCLPLIQKLIDDPYGWVFRDPVDPDELGIPDYFEIIKEAMDLSLIKRKLENREYNCIDNFERETKLVFHNSILYNGENSDVGDMAKTLSSFFQKQLKFLMKGIKTEHQAHKKKKDACNLCGCIRRHFEPSVLYCSGSCGMQIIERDATYYADKFNLNNWCSSCHKDLNDSTPLFLNNGIELKKSDLLKLVNNEVGDEAWIKCDGCKSWVHQICALYNGPKEKSSSYTCPKCYVDKKKKSPDTDDRWLVPLKGARDLPTCGLSDALELGLKKRLETAYFEKTEISGSNAKCIDRVEGLCIRVVSNVAKNTVVQKEMLERYGYQGCPRQYPHRSKCIVLFQTIHGADVMLFAMYVHEYGDTCPPPNRRRVYISYLDSINYMQPPTYRTMVYQSIIKEYLKSLKLRGFHTAHIWSCPPSNGHDYILNCHSPKQRIPRPDLLCSWYSKLLADAKGEGVVLDVRSYYDEYLKNDGMFSAAVRPNDPTCLPYFEGDYVPGELENIITSVKGAYGQDKVLTGMSQSMNNMKQYFVVVHLRSRKFANACDRGENVSHWSEEDEKLLNKVYGKDASVLHGTSPEVKKDEVRKLGKKDAPKNLTKIGDAIDKDMYNDCEMFGSRHHFLHFSQQKHLQFDELRRAKHSTMIILHHLHNHAAPRFFQQCGICYREICNGTRYHCNDCPNFDLCVECYEPAINGLWDQRETRFSHDKSHTFSAIKCESSSDSSYLSQEERANNVKIHLEILSHTASCEGAPRCNSSNCQRMKLLFIHLQTCTKTFREGCKVCDRFLSLLSIHARSCSLPTGTCVIPFCDMLRERNQRLNQKQHLLNDGRRIAQNNP